MKKVLVLLAVFALSYSVQAQEIGARFGDVTGGPAAVDAIFSVGEFSRIHADISFGSGVGVEALWDFLYRPVGDTDFTWYVGVGPSMRIDDPFSLGVSGEVGMAYYFDFPMSLSLDYRPTFVILENTNFYGGGFGFNVRYVFQ